MSNRLLIDGTQGLVERVNWSTDPAATGTGSWEGVASSGTVTTTFISGIASNPPGTNLDTIFRVEPDAAVPDGSTVQHVYRASPSGWSVGAGREITGSIFLRSMDRDVEARVSVYDAEAGATPTTGPWVSVAGVPAGTGWVRLDETDLVEGATSTGFQIRVQVRQHLGGDQILAGDKFDVTGVMMESGSTLSPYFDGATPASGGVDHRWVDTENDSPSIAVRESAHSIGVIRRNLASWPQPTSAAQSNGSFTSAANGGKASSGVIDGYLDGVTDYYKMTTFGDSTSFQMIHKVLLPDRMEPSTDYASSLLVRSTQALSIQFFIGDGGQTVHLDTFELAANEWTLLSTLWTSFALADPEFVMGFLQDDDTLLAGESMFIAQPLHEEGVVLGTYFDGDTSPNTRWEEDMTSALYGFL